MGYRITYGFVRTFFGRMFANPGRVFDTAMLKPETQGMEAYVDGILNITEAQKSVAAHYFEDGSIELACPPLQALLNIMAQGQWKGKDASHADVRKMFTREYLLASDWYLDRLKTKQARDIALWQRHVSYLEDYMDEPAHADDVDRLDIRGKLVKAKAELERVSTQAYLRSLIGTVGADPRN